MKSRCFPMNGNRGSQAVLHHAFTITTPGIRIQGFVMKKIVLYSCILFLLTTAPALAAEAATPAAATDGEEQVYGSVEERRLREAIEGGEHSALARERENLEDRKKELKRLEEEVDKKLEQLNQLRLSVEKLLAEKDAAEQKQIQALAKLYEKMTADKAATVLATVDQGLAVAILKQMKTKSAAKILNSMEREKAAKVTTGISTLDTE